MTYTHRMHVYRKPEFVPIFRLRLRNGGSIGPELLKRLWSLAAGSEHVGVSRTLLGPEGAASYVVTAQSAPADVASVEARLRRLLQERLSTAHVQLTRLA
ncbi:MAG TPA: hypothetical protein VI258_13050 [Rhodanobacteraceae bacterium]